MLSCKGYKLRWEGWSWMRATTLPTPSPRVSTIIIVMVFGIIAN